MMRKEWLTRLKEKRILIAIAVFALVVAIAMAWGSFGLHVSLVALSVLVMIEAGIAVMLHKVELWIHVMMILAQVIAGVIISRVGVTLLCALVYGAATAALWVFDLEEASGKNE